MAEKISRETGAPNGGRSNLLKLAKRMSQSFMRNVSSSIEKTWKLMTSACYTRNIFVSTEHFENYIGRPDVNVISVASCVSLAFTADKFYGSRQRAECHPKIYGMDLLKCLQACFTDSNSMYIVWTFIKTATTNAIMAGGDPDAVDILVSGAVVLPWGPMVEDEGSILSASFESLDESEGPPLQKDALYADITKTILLVNEIHTTPYEDHGCDEDESW